MRIEIVRAIVGTERRAVTQVIETDDVAQTLARLRFVRFAADETGFSMLRPGDRALVPDQQRVLEYRDGQWVETSRRGRGGTEQARLF